MNKDILTPVCSDDIDPSFLNLIFSHHKTIDSTNSEAIRLAKAGKAKEAGGIVVTADFQSAGRGRENRIWESAGGGDLLMSILLKPHVSLNKLSGITLLTAAVIQKTLEKLGTESSIKPPNDILVTGKKICGILIESSSQGNEIQWCVIGVGLNVNSVLGDIPADATSLRLVLGKTFEIDQVKSVLLNCFQNKYKEWLRNVGN